MVLTNYNKPFDENISSLWEILFSRLDADLFRKACLAAIKKNKFFPNANELLDTYQQIDEKEKKERSESLRLNQKLLTDGQGDCYLCDNTGFCIFDKNGYETTARCSCPRGRDLIRFSKSQINKHNLPEASANYGERDKAEIRREKNPFYWPDIAESLGADFYVFEARRKEKYLSGQKSMSAEKKLEILRRMESESLGKWQTEIPVKGIPPGFAAVEEDIAF